MSSCGYELLIQLNALLRVPKPLDLSESRQELSSGGLRSPQEVLNYIEEIVQNGTLEKINFRKYIIRKVIKCLIMYKKLEKEGEK